MELQYKLRGGEFRIAHQGHNFRVDAIDHSSNTVYEVLGCFYHGCEKHAGRDEVHLYNGKTMAQVSFAQLEGSKNTAKLLYNSRNVKIYRSWRKRRLA